MASNYLAKYLKAGGGGQIKVGTSFSSTMSNNVSASVAKNAPGSIQNFAKIGKDMYIHTDDVGKIVKGAHGAGVSSGRLAGHFAGAQKGKIAGQAMASSAFRTGVGAGARAMFGPAAIAGGALMHYAGKGRDRAKTNPGFHKGKAGKSYLDLSTKTPGKYGIDY
jgi:hypothetical protein